MPSVLTLVLKTFFPLLSTLAEAYFAKFLTDPFEKLHPPLICVCQSNGVFRRTKMQVLFCGYTKQMWVPILDG